MKVIPWLIISSLLFESLVPFCFLILSVKFCFLSRNFGMSVNLLVPFPIPSITFLSLDSWLSFIVLGSLWVLSFWKSASFYSRKYSQVISLGFCGGLVFWFCFWTSHCSDMKPSEQVVWFFFFFPVFCFVLLCSRSLFQLAQFFFKPFYSGFYFSDIPFYFLRAPLTRSLFSHLFSEDINHKVAFF